MILGLNLKEATQVAEVLGLPDRADREATIEEDAAAIRQALGLACVVIHPRKAAAAATEPRSARFPGPFVQHPKISTGAGDHFNAGFCLGRILGLGLEESLCAGVASSGYYVRTARSATAAELAGFIDELPASERESRRAGLAWVPYSGILDHGRACRRTSGLGEASSSRTRSVRRVIAVFWGATSGPEQEVSMMRVTAPRFTMGRLIVAVAIAGFLFAALRYDVGMRLCRLPLGVRRVRGLGRRGGPGPGETPGSPPWASPR